MSDELTDEELAAWEREALATPGPAWRMTRGMLRDMTPAFFLEATGDDEHICTVVSAYEHSARVAQFLADARERELRLIAEVKRLREAVASHKHEAIERGL